MPCNCKKCDCQDARLCYLVTSRLTALACIFDKVADNVISSTDTSIFDNFYDVGPISTCTYGQTITPIVPTTSLIAPYTLTGPMLDELAKKQEKINFSFILHPSFALNELFIIHSAKGNIPLFGSLKGLEPASFISQHPVNQSITIGICFPSISPTDPSCLTCTAITTAIPYLCSISTDPNDLSNYAALAQNLRYIIALVGCD